MEFEDMSPEVEWECQRVSTAFGVNEWMIRKPAPSTPYIVCESSNTCPEVSWQIRKGSGWLDVDAHEWAWSWVKLADGLEGSCLIYSTIDPLRWHLRSYSKHHEQMARGLYRLGFEDEGVLSQLPTLSNHEKLELRLSMPREFWPQKWRDEEEQRGNIRFPANPSPTPLFMEQAKHSRAKQ